MFKKIFFLFIFLAAGFTAFAQNYPQKSNSLVNDFPGIMSSGDRAKLETKLDSFDDTTSTQIAIVLVKTIGDYDIIQYGTELGRRWGIGQGRKNNGLLIIAAVDDRKVAILPGYGLEGAVPDIVTHQIIEKDIKPYFRNKDYYGGLDAATTDIIKYTKGEYKADKKPDDSNSGSNVGGGIITLIIIVIFILIFIFRNRGGGGQIIGGRGSASPFWWFLAGDILGGSGRGGGGWGGGSGGGFGGGGGGGGFGGFGGGSFGGGGSSGSW
jgi:uncharacterized protein